MDHAEKPPSFATASGVPPDLATSSAIAWRLTRDIRRLPPAAERAHSIPPPREERSGTTGIESTAPLAHPGIADSTPLIRLCA